MASARKPILYRVASEITINCFCTVNFGPWHKHSRFMTKDQRTYLVKKLIYKSNNRGCKETDIILGNFSNKYLLGFSDQEISQFELILDQTDADIMDWVNGKSEVPDTISKNMIDKLSKMGTA